MRNIFRIYRSRIRTVFVTSNKTVLTAHNYGKYITGHDNIYRFEKLNNRKISISQKLFSDYPKHNVVSLPNLSPTMETGSILSWAVSVGDEVEEGDLLAEIETDKASMGMEASEPGFIAKILLPAGSKDVPVGAQLLVIVSDKNHIEKFADFVPSADIAKPIEVSSSVEKISVPSSKPIKTPISQVEPPSEVSQSIPSGSRLFISPYAKKLAIEAGVDINDLYGYGSGPHGRIRAQDVLNRGSFIKPTIETLSPFHDTDLTGMRKTIAKRLTMSKQSVPHYYLTVDIEMDNLMKLRLSTNQMLVEQKIPTKLSVNDFIIKASALSCLEVPSCNSAWMENFIREFKSVDVSVAVSTPSGLITPIIFSANSKNLKIINSEIMSLGEKARTGKLKPEEFQGGTFTVSNLGMFGIDHFSAIINPPQSCILAVGGTNRKLVPCDYSQLGVKTATIMSVTLCCDHRVVDGAIGAQWLQKFKQFLQKPETMLLYN